MSRAALVLAALVILDPIPAHADGPIPVQVVRTADGWQLLRGGGPYFIKGAGGSTSLKALAEAGGNSIRTWGVDHADAILDEAKRLGLTVTLGIWLGHERHGFDYNNPDQVARQLESARQAILRYKDHPALLMWGLGNEMEGPKGDRAAIWSAVNNIAAMAKQLDPNHPTMTVVAEIGGEKVKNVHRLCPEIDVVGINSYGGAPTLADRYRKAGGTRPFVLTEFGPNGSWEVEKTRWGAPFEPTSTQKAATYRQTYLRCVAANRNLCLGSYAFVWGHKQETTATWFGLFLPDGARTPAVDDLTELWSGRPPADRCPTIRPLRLEGPTELDPGASARVALSADDPEHGPIRVRWELRRDGAYASGGDAEAVPPAFPNAIVQPTQNGVTLKMPEGGGGYRLYAFVYDRQGGAASASLPLFVKGRVAMPKAQHAALPLVVYEEPDRPQAFAPSGWMGNQAAVKLDPNCREAPHSGRACIRVEYNDRRDWAGVVWQHPANDWGDVPGGYNLTGAKRLTFWARGAKGGEFVGFAFGLIPREKPFHDTAHGKLERVPLSAEWKRYSIDLTGQDLSRIISGFCWTATGDDGPLMFFLDEIRFE